ncbi:MAG: hypothetical protein H6709_16445 [Kofleriaceae bacterium]|nr:hypothetical protein [Kofleriaceae bacterium]
MPLGALVDGAAAARAAVARGVTTVKLKLGVAATGGQDVAAAAGAVAAVRAAVGPDVAIRADANRAFGSATCRRCSPRWPRTTSPTSRSRPPAWARRCRRWGGSRCRSRSTRAWPSPTRRAGSTTRSPPARSPRSCSSPPCWARRACSRSPHAPPPPGSARS